MRLPALTVVVLALVLACPVLAAAGPDGNAFEIQTLSTRPHPVSGGDVFEQMDRWLTAIQADSSSLPKGRKVVANKPADAVDACWDLSGVRRAETQTAFGPGLCNTIYPASRTPNLVAGAPIQGRILECQLKAPDPADYAVGFTAAQWGRLHAIFPGGEATHAKTWASFGPSPRNQLYDVTDPHGQP